MAPSSKLPVKTSVHPHPAAKPEKPVKSEPFLSVYFSRALHRKVLLVLDALEESPNPEQHRDALSAVVVELMNAGMEYCFMKPLKLAKPGFIIQQSANLGMSGALQVLGSVIRNIIGRMDKHQLLSVCGSIRHLMRTEMRAD